MLLRPGRTGPFWSDFSKAGFTLLVVVQGEMVIRPNTFRSDWSYFMNFRVIGLIAAIPG